MHNYRRAQHFSLRQTPHSRADLIQSGRRLRALYGGRPQKESSYWLPRRICVSRDFTASYRASTTAFESRPYVIDAL